MYLFWKETVIRIAVMAANTITHTHTHTQVLILLCHTHLNLSKVLSPSTADTHTRTRRRAWQPSNIRHADLHSRSIYEHTHTHVHVLENIANTGALSYAPTRSDSQTRTDTDTGVIYNELPMLHRLTTPADTYSCIQMCIREKYAAWKHVHDSENKCVEKHNTSDRRIISFSSS